MVLYFLAVHLQLLTENGIIHDVENRIKIIVCSSFLVHIGLGTRVGGCLRFENGFK